jgi:hypothetical protein
LDFADLDPENLTVNCKAIVLGQAALHSPGNYMPPVSHQLPKLTSTDVTCSLPQNNMKFEANEMILISLSEWLDLEGTQIQMQRGQGAERVLSFLGNLGSVVLVHLMFL